MLIYLSSRIQRVRIGTCLGNYNTIKNGLLQGSVLEPLLFSIFTNDIFYTYETFSLSTETSALSPRFRSIVTFDHLTGSFKSLMDYGKF